MKTTPLNTYDSNRGKPEMWIGTRFDNDFYNIYIKANKFDFKCKILNRLLSLGSPIWSAGLKIVCNIAILGSGVE